MEKKAWLTEWSQSGNKKLLCMSLKNIPFGIHSEIDSRDGGLFIRIDNMWCDEWRIIRDAISKALGE